MRRSTRLTKADDKSNGTPVSYLEDSNRPRTRRSSSHASISDAVTNYKQNFHDDLLEKIYKSSDVTPRKNQNQTKPMKRNKYLDDNESDDEELYNPSSKNRNTGKSPTEKNYKCTLAVDNDTIRMKFTIEKTECKLMIGAKEEPKDNEKFIDNNMKLRNSMGNIRSRIISNNQDDLMNEHERECSKKVVSATPSKAYKCNESQLSAQAVGNSPRKRSSENNSQDFHGTGVDDNEISQAHQLMSPPKRPKSQMGIGQTPQKNLGSLDETHVPKSVKRKLMDDDQSSQPMDISDSHRVRTRQSTANRQGTTNYKEWSSSDDNNTKKIDKEAKVLVSKLDPKKLPKKSGRKSSRIDQAQESEESEIENKMVNANKNNLGKKSKSKSTLLHTPVSKSKLPFSPSKGMENLNINENGATPRSSRRLNFKSKKTLESTPSKDTKAQYELRKSQRIVKTIIDIEDFSDEESADSSDDYETENSSSSSDNEEFQEKRRNQRIQQTPRKNAATPKINKKVVKVSMDTPTKAISRMSLGTPTLDKHRRTIEISKPSTPLQKARATLHVSVLPKSLPCREEQFNDIYSFLHARLSDGSGGCIYISGVPGTGKTATVSEVIRCLKKAMGKGELPKFDYIDINGMKLSEPRQAYVQIWKQIAGETKTWEESHKLLQSKFTNSNAKRNMTLLLVDELDLLCTKRQDVVYNLLDWPSKTNAKLVVVTIANTMDLPERILMGKVTSRLGLTRLTFPPYNFKQLEEIVVSRLKGANAFGGETIQLVARKVAAVSGDARRALDICRRSAEIAEKNGRQQVNMLDVKQALDEMIASPKIQAIKHCSEMEKYFLLGVCSEVQRTGLEEVVFKNVYMQMETLCSVGGIKTPNISEALEICARLGSWRLLLCDHSRMDIHQRLLLNVSTDDVYFATKNINA